MDLGDLDSMITAIKMLHMNVVLRKLIRLRQIVFEVS